MIIVRFFVAFRKKEPLYVVKRQIEMNKNDISGSRTKNRLTVQISYAMQLIMEYYSMDYVILIGVFVFSIFGL